SCSTRRSLLLASKIVISSVITMLREAMMSVTLRKIGNSEGVILPKELLESLNLKTGDKLEAIRTNDGIALRPIDDVFERQMKAAREFMGKYKVALQKLAE